MNGVIGMTELALDTELSPTAARLPRHRQVVGRFAADDPQRHPGLLEDRVAQAGARVDPVLGPRFGGHPAQAAGSEGGAKRAGAPARRRPRSPRRNRRRSGPSPAGPDQPRRQCHQVHCARPRDARSSRGCPLRRIHEAAFPSQRHGNRDPVRQTCHDFRSLQPGRRIDNPAVRRHRPGPDDFVKPGASDGRAPVGRERARLRQRPFTSPPASTWSSWARPSGLPSRCSPNCRC